jgi:DNA mismatch repair protein MutS
VTAASSRYNPVAMTTTRSQKAQTPVMRQYLSAKESYPDALLFFRMGDFYELFFEDAVVAARALDLKLTTRDRNDPDPIPMCGVPHHAAQTYIPRLLELGHNVAICEQLEDPAKAKGIVKRSVVRVLTPALVLDGEALAPRANQFLAAVVAPDAGPEAPGAWGLAAFDLTTGEMFVGEAGDLTALAGELARLDARELIVAPAAEGPVREMAKLLPRLFVRTVAPLSPREGVDVLASALGEANLRDAVAGVSVGARTAAAMALEYARATQPGHPVSVQRFVALDARDYLALDETAQHHLELFRTTRGEKKGALLTHVDATVTPMGARRLRNWLAFPLTDVRRIRRRHDAVEALVRNPDARDALRGELEHVPDLERIAMRATLGIATPRDLGALRDGLSRVPRIAAVVETLGAAFKPLRLVDDAGPLRQLLERALVDSPPSAVGEGPVFRAGYDPRLDAAVELASGGRGQVAAIEQRERERTKIASLKIGYNRVFGYYVEVTKANLKNVPADYKRKQTIAGGERFITEELYELEQKILAAEEEQRALETQRFEELTAEVARVATTLSRLASSLADLDALAAFADVAHRWDYVRPEIDDGGVIELRDARHPVVESVLEPGTFVPNDVTLDARGERLLLVTGPNMAGKSTLMRQVALNVLLAQAGAFVPARAARIGVVDRIFTRVGASDDLARGQSTFMVEMRETASILRGATSRSLVVFDEIGRGTSTFDGLAIAWAVAEYLHDVVKCRALFATHYHELCALAETRPHAANVNVSARETGDDIVFLHKLARGGASRSYGIAVARLAGLPEPVVARARALLKDLERGEGPGARPKQRGLFEPKPEPVEHPVLAALAAADVDRMTPLDALNFLSQLRALARASH